jgi:hypothetical protein
MTRRLHSVTAPVAEDLAAQDESLAVQCPKCGAERDAYCVNPLTDGQHLHGRTSHFQRIQAARTEDPT